MAKKTTKRVKWGIGISILVAFVLVSLIVMNQEKNLGLFLLVGLGLGYAESRSEVGIASGYVNFFVTGNRHRFYGLLLLFTFGSIGAFIIHALAAAQGAVPEHLASSSAMTIPGTSAVTPVNFGLVLGAFLFGVGLTLNKGCGLGTLRNIGLGQTRYLLTIVFLLIGTIPGQWLKYELDQSVLHQISIEVYFPEVFGYRGTAVIGILIYSVLIFLAIMYEKRRKEKNRFKEVEPSNLPEIEPEKDASFYKVLFENSWARLISVLFITLLLLIVLGVTGEKLAVTESFKYPAVAIFQQLGVEFSSPAFDEAMQVVEEGVLKNNVVLQNIGIVFGAAVLALTSARFSLTWVASFKDSVLYALSGLLMGIGAVLTSGCIVGALYSGIVNFSLSGWVVFAGMSAGIWLTVQTMNGKISSIPAITEE